MKKTHSNGTETVVLLPAWIFDGYWNAVSSLECSDMSPKPSTASLYRRSVGNNVWSIYSVVVVNVFDHLATCYDLNLLKKLAGKGLITCKGLAPSRLFSLNKTLTLLGSNQSVPVRLNLIKLVPPRGTYSVPLLGQKLTDLRSVTKLAEFGSLKLRESINASWTRNKPMSL